MTGFLNICSSYGLAKYCQITDWVGVLLVHGPTQLFVGHNFVDKIKSKIQLSVICICVLKEFAVPVTLFAIMCHLEIYMPFLHPYYVLKASLLTRILLPVTVYSEVKIVSKFLLQQDYCTAHWSRCQLEVA